MANTWCQKRTIFSCNTLWVLTMSCSHPAPPMPDDVIGFQKCGWYLRNSSLSELNWVSGFSSSSTVASYPMDALRSSSVREAPNPALRIK